MKASIPISGVTWSDARETLVLSDLRRESLSIPEGVPGGEAKPQAGPTNEFAELKRAGSIETMESVEDKVAKEVGEIDSCIAIARLKLDYPEDSKERQALGETFRQHMGTALGHLLVSKLDKEHADLCAKLLRDIVLKSPEVPR